MHEVLHPTLHDVLPPTMHKVLPPTMHEVLPPTMHEVAFNKLDGCLTFGVKGGGEQTKSRVASPHGAK